MTEKPRKPSERDEREIQAAEAEARRIGGEVAPLSDDPAREPLEEAGQGEAEGREADQPIPPDE